MAFRTVILVLMIAIFATSAVAQYSNEYSIDLGFPAQNDGNGGLVVDALDMDEEMMMESESARRQLRGKNNGKGGHVSYGAMSRGNTPCNQRGQSYYSSCRAHQQANPYNRQCTRATRCLRNTR